MIELGRRIWECSDFCVEKEKCEKDWDSRCDFLKVIIDVSLEKTIACAVATVNNEGADRTGAEDS